MFHALTKASEVLSDESQKSLYDYYLDNPNVCNLHTSFTSFTSYYAY